MKRRHLREDIVRVIQRIRDEWPEATIGANVIAGFPTESDAHFERPKRWCLVWIWFMCFLSAHQQTPASKMPQVAAR